jgi:hypothetical protein
LPFANPKEISMTELEPSTPETTAFPPPPEMLSRVVDFIGHHLQCTQEQRIVLALWIIHTHCFTAFFTAPYLDIHSSQKQAGKSICLELLSLLCNESWLTCGFTSSILAQRVNHEPLTLLLDEREATLGSARRPKSPVLLAMLNSGFQKSVSHQDRNTPCLDIFCPKAFAGTAPLPESLAQRSIPIFLEPLEPEDSEDSVQRFFPSQARKEAEDLVPWIEQWSEENLSRLSAEPFRLPDGLSPVLSHRQQDLIEPLLHVAQAIGGSWPHQAAQALLTVFRQSLMPQQNYAVQLLADLENAFEAPGDARYLPTSFLLRWLHNLDDRAWSVWHEGRPLNDQDMARMLQPFGVYPRNVRREDAKVVRCYLRSEVEYASSQRQSRRQSLADLKIEIPNKDAGCSKVVESSILPSSAAGQAGVELPSGGSRSASGCAGSAVEPPAAAPEVYVPQPQRPSYNEIVNKYRDSSKAKAPAIDTYPEYPQRYSYSG